MEGTASTAWPNGGNPLSKAGKRFPSRSFQTSSSLLAASAEGWDRLQHANRTSGAQMESLHTIKQLRKQGPGLHSLSSIPTSSASTLFPPPYRPLLPPRPLSLTHPRAQPRTSATSSHQQGWDVPVPSCPSGMLSIPGEEAELPAHSQCRQQRLQTVTSPKAALSYRQVQNTFIVLTLPATAQGSLSKGYSR